MAIAAAIPVVGAALGGGATAGAAAGGGISIGSVIVPLLGGLALSAGAMLFAPDPASEQSAAKTKETVGEIGPRSIVMGTCAVRGRPIHDNVYGNDKRRYQFVDLIATEQITGITALILDGKRQTIKNNSRDGFRYSVDGYGDGADARYLFDWAPGTANQAAFSGMTAHSEGGWTSAHRGRSCALGFGNLSFRPKEFPSRRPPERSYVVQGGKRWDFRKDSTMDGGSGSHRWDDPSTWEFSRNPMVQLAFYLRGHWVAGKLWVGEGRAVDEIDWESFMASAAACDETVTNPDGTTRPRYALDFQALGGSSQNIREVLDEVAKATHGIWGEADGKLFFHVGYDRAPVATITDDDLDRGPGRVFDMSGKLDKEQGLVNEVSGTYVNAKKRYQIKPLKTVRSASAIEADGRVIPMHIQFKGVTERWQGRQILLQVLEASRLQWNGQISVGPALALKLQSGDIILWSSARYNWVRRFRIERTERAFGDTGIYSNLTLRETASSVWDDQLDDYDEGDGYQGEPQPALAAPENLAATAVYETGTNGKKIASAVVTWRPPDDDTLDRIVFQVRRTGAARAYGSACDTPEDGSDTVRNGLGVDGEHQIRASFVRPSEGKAKRAWSDWVTITSDGDGGGPGDVTPPPRPSRASLSYGTSYSVEAKGRRKTVEVAVTWEAVLASDFHEYHARYRKKGTARWRYLAGLVDATAEFDAAEGVKYEFQVRALDQARNPSGWTPSTSESAFLVTAAVDKDPPAAPRGASARGGHRRVVHRWTNAVDLDLRWVEVWGARRTGASAPASLAAAKARRLEEVIGSSWVQDDLGLGETWDYWYRSIDTSGNQSVYYPPHTGPGLTAKTKRIDDDDLGDRVPGQAGAPAAVQWETVTGADGSLTVTAPLAWTAPAANSVYVPAASYQLEVTRGKQVSIIPVGGLGFAYVGVPGGKYSFRVRAVSRTGKPGAWSTARTATAPSDTVAPPVPTGVIATGGIRSVAVRIQGARSADFARYDLFWKASASPAPGANTAPLDQTDSRTAIISDLAPGTALYVWARAVDKFDNASAWKRSGSAATARRVGRADIEAGEVVGTRRWKDDRAVTSSSTIMQFTVARRRGTVLQMFFYAMMKEFKIVSETKVFLKGTTVVKRGTKEIYRRDIGCPMTSSSSGTLMAGGQIHWSLLDEDDIADGNYTYTVERGFPTSSDNASAISLRECYYTHIMR